MLEKYEPDAESSEILKEEADNMVFTIDAVFEPHRLARVFAHRENNLHASEAGFQQIVARLEQEGYLKSEPKNSPKPAFISLLDKFFAGKGTLSVSRGNQLGWAFVILISISIVFFAGIWYGNGWKGEDEFATPKAEQPPYEIVVVSPEPQQKAQEIFQKLAFIEHIELQVSPDDKNTLNVEVPLADLSEAQEQQLDAFLVANDWSLPVGFDLVFQVTSFYINRIPYSVPQEEALELQEAFTQLGAKAEVAKVSETLWRLDIHLPKTDSDALIRFMGNYNLRESVPDSRYVYVEIEAEEF